MTITPSIDERLLAAQVATGNALSDPDILAALTGFGYDAAKITVGKEPLTSFRN